MSADQPIPSAPLCYIGIGASAGGLEALDKFFEAIPSTTDLAFVVVQHLSPDYKSLMAELLSKHTEMEVFRAEEGMAVEANKVYIIPPRKNIRLFHGRIMLSEQERNERGINLPIDIFFKSLADDQGEKSVGVVLSGTGSDGARGIRAIKEAGGMVMAQSEDTARFDGMPRAAIATGMCDFVLPVDEMPQRLLAFAKHPYITQPASPSPLLMNEDRLARIFALLREHSRVDFALYKQSTIVRRIERRMTVNQIEDLADYVSFLETRRTEVTALGRELLIGVTSFFRDPQVWQELMKHQLQTLFKNRPQKDVRMWVAGCSTGEEAYSLAMACSDVMEARGERYDVKIFATDVDRDAIVTAGNGDYPEAVAADLPARQLTKYFSRQGDRYRIIRSIREMVVFAQHNLLADPPFTNLDLVSCRNLLIYLQPVLQQKILDSFNFALNAEGLLMLGTSETIGDSGHYFEPVDAKLRLYRSLGRARAVGTGDLAVTNTRWSMAERRRGSLSAPTHSREEERIIDRLLTTLGADTVPLTVVVNEQLEILHILGDTTGYMKLPAGKVMNDVSRMVVSELSIPLATGLRKVFATGNEIRYNNVHLVDGDDDHRMVDLHIRLLKGRTGQATLAVFSIAKKQRPAGDVDSEDSSQTYDAMAATEQRIRDLEQELQFSRENLQATIEELETSNEELQATNEELLASNEELQSTNEELQSVNEELHTVNTEFQQKILELTQLNNDFDNLLSSSHIYSMFLDQNLDVRKFTPDLDAVFPLISSDIGRPFEHLRHRLKNIDPLELVRSVERDGQQREVEVQAENGAWYLLRILPYQMSDGHPSGIVLTLVEISRLKSAQAELGERQKQTARFFETMDEGVVIQNTEGAIVDANTAAQDILGLDLDQMTGRSSMDPRWRAVRADGSDYPGDEHPAMRTLREGRPMHGEIMGVFNPRQDRINWLRVSSVPLFELDGKSVKQVYTRFAVVDGPADEATERG